MLSSARINELYLSARLTLTDNALRNRDAVVYLHLEVIDEMTRVEIDVANAKQYINRVKHSADKADSTVDTIGATVRKLDEVVKAVDQVVGKASLPYLLEVAHR